VAPEIFTPDGTTGMLRIRGVPSLNENNQTASAASLFFTYRLLHRDICTLLNRLEFSWSNGSYFPNFGAALQLLARTDIILFLSIVSQSTL